MKLMLGMLWLYCDVNKSFGFFKEIAETNIFELRIKEVLNLIEQNIKSINKNTN